MLWSVIYLVVALIAIGQVLMETWLLDGISHSGNSDAADVISQLWVFVPVVKNWS